MTRRKITDDGWLLQLADQTVGHWHLQEFVGAGNVGVVYRATSTRVPDWHVAVKVLKKTPRPGWDTEIIKVSKLRNIDSIVAFHGVESEMVHFQGQSRHLVLTVWDYIPPGRSLRDYLRAGEGRTASFLLAVVQTVLIVLNACRARGVSRHGDLHSGNILIGEPDAARLDESLNPLMPIYVSDFGYGTTGAVKQPKDDYLGLAEIGRDILEVIEWHRANADDRHTILAVREVLQKLLQETQQAERQEPLEILRTLREIRRNVTRSQVTTESKELSGATHPRDAGAVMGVGQFQVSEMLGDRWDLWRRLFVFAVPARSRVLEPDITTVLTGPRGCGKTMLFRRLSERLILECGPVDGQSRADFVAFYINANDVADAFATFPESPDRQEEQRLLCYANLCLLSDVLTVVSAHDRISGERPDARWSELLDHWLGPSAHGGAVTNEVEIDRYRNLIEELKWRFPERSENAAGVIRELGRHDWPKRLVSEIRKLCRFAEGRNVIFLVDDYTTPRVSRSMQKVLNREFFQRGGDFVFKIATEAATTFIAQDNSEKLLQDGDDYQLIDMGEESLFLAEQERFEFLNAVFGRRLALDARVPEGARSLTGLLGRLGTSKTEFARRLRGEDTKRAEESALRERRGRTKPKVLYNGADVFACLWSGDTRIMIQLIQELVEEGLKEQQQLDGGVRPELQDRVFRNRGGDWLNVQVRNLPTQLRLVDSLVARRPGFAFAGGSYGAHLKAIVEAFKEAARSLLLGPTYVELTKSGRREVPRMAFRIEVTDRFRLDELETEIYSDLLRYGLFLRDNRGKSVQGAMVPRLFLRRLLLPYCVLPLSRRDSVQMSCAWFCRLLTAPDAFVEEWAQHRHTAMPQPDQMAMFGGRALEGEVNYPEDEFESNGPADD